MKSYDHCVKKNRKNGRRHTFFSAFLLIFLLGIQNPVTISAAVQQPVSVKLTKATAEDVIKNIARTTRYRFSYVAADVKAIPLKDYSFTNSNIKDVMDHMLAGTQFKWSDDNGIITISRKSSLRDADNILIAGIVRDDKGRPLAGATIKSLDRSIEMVSDANGEFAMVTTIGATIEVRYLGYNPSRFVIEPNRNQYTIILTVGAFKIDEITVTTGYQKIDRKDMVGAHTILDMEDILMPNYTTVDAMLQGQVAGLVVSNSSTRAGTSPSMTLRGTSTLLGTTSPLWVVDGIIQEDVSTSGGFNQMTSSVEGTDIASFVGNSISWLNPHDIETVVVLKDASATAIYGARASNGVIVITTKHSKAENVSINYSGSMTVAFRPTYDDYYLMNSKERINFSKESFDAGAYYQNKPLAQMYTYEGLEMLYQQKKITEAEFIEQYKKLEVVNTDWLDLVTRTTFSSQHNLSLAGGSDAARFNASVNYSETQGTEKGNDQRSYGGRVNLKFQPAKRLSANLSLTGTVTETSSFAAKVNPQSYAISTSRAIPAFDENGDNLFYQKEESYRYNKNATKETGFKYNILNEIANTYSKNKSLHVSANANINYAIISDGSLSYEFVGGFTSYARNSESYADENTFYITHMYRGYDYGSIEDVSSPEFQAAMLPYGGELLRNSTTSQSYNIQNKLLYSKTIDSRHRINAMVAMEVRSNTTESNDNLVYGYLKNRSGQVIAPPAPTDIKPITDTAPVGGMLMQNIYNSAIIYKQTDNYLSLFASTAYSYNDRYIFNFTIRNDVSNRFGQDVNQRFDPTYSLGLSWRLSEEKFAQSLKPFLSDIQIRVSYGIQGNVLTNISPEIILSTPKLNTVYNQFTSSIISLPNPLLQWERTKTTNIGMNLGFFNNRIQFDIDAYQRTSRPLTNYILPAEYGDNTIPQQGAKVTNKGFEITAYFTPIRSQDVRMSIGVNFSRNWNNVESMISDETQNKMVEQYLNGNSSTTGVLLERGYPVDGFWVYDFDGLDPETGYPLFAKMDMTDYESLADFLVYAGSKEPYMTGGFNLNFSYKRLTLSAGFSALLGGMTLLPNPYQNFAYGYLPSPELNLSKELIDRWREPGDELHTSIPAVYTGGTNINVMLPTGNTVSFYDMWASSDVRLVSKSFLRCRSVSMGWSLSQRMAKAIGVRNLNISGTLNNLFVIASRKFKGMDPETGLSVMPMSFSIGVNISF